MGSPRRVRCCLFMLFLALLCEGCSKADLRHIGKIELHRVAKEELEAVYGRHRSLSMGVWQDLEPGMWANDRLPDWASSDFDSCVYWTDRYSVSQSQRPYASGVVQGWIAIARDMELLILEISYVEDETGKAETLIDQWSGPAGGTSAD